jgi:hypothetical protein
LFGPIEQACPLDLERSLTGRQVFLTYRLCFGLSLGADAFNLDLSSSFDLGYLPFSFNLQGL